jgi:hypothetical protein
MQPSNSLPEQEADYNRTNILTAFEDIATNIRIQSDFSITHPNYQPLKPPEEIRPKLANLPPDSQSKYLKLLLGIFLKGIYYNGELEFTNLKKIAANSENVWFENKNTDGVDREFLKRLHDNNFGKGYYDLGWTVLKEARDNLIVVRKNNLNLHIERDRYLSLEQQSAQRGDRVAVKMPRNFLEQGFYVAVGDAGKPYTGDRSNIVNVYFNLNFEGAVAVIESLTKQLNAIEVPFTFKTLYDSLEYDRYDSGILNFKQADYSKLKPVLENIYRQNQAYFGKEVPLFSKLLAPGLGLAEEPECQDFPEDNFGKHRCQLLVEALMETRQQHDSPKFRLESIRQHFLQAKLDLDRPHLCFSNEDVY